MVIRKWAELLMYSESYAYTYFHSYTDGLIRWKLVTHAGIDGFSRMIVYMQCSNNNRSATVYAAFLKAVHQYGLPSRVRSDQGRENQLVAQHMLEHRGSERRSMITGSSVHNQRIERLWRDMHQCVVKVFYQLFYYLEEQGLLDPNDDIHIFALHYVYIPRVNKSLMAFREGWNNHGARTQPLPTFCIRCSTDAAFRADRT